jgi:cytochrome c-type biogenesis protein CcmH
MKRLRSPLLLVALLALVGAVWSYTWIATPPQQTLDQHVYNVAAQLKCPVCQNESVADSSASISEQMRLVIRQRLQSGQSEQQVLAYFALRYGNQILLTPPQQGFNLLAWLVPAAMLLLGLALVSFVAYDWRKQARLQTGRVSGQQTEDLLDDAELEEYRARLERELADDDPLFGTPGRERN